MPQCPLTTSNSVTSFMLATTLVACTSMQSPLPTVPEPGDSSEVFHEALHWSRNSAEHRAIFEQTFKLALQRLEELTTDKEPGTWAISSDADETLIDNSLYEVEINQQGVTFSSESWHQWVLRKEAPALPGAVAFTARVKEMGGVVAVVTNRRSHQCQPTADNLRAQGVNFDIVLCRHEVRDKEPRWEALTNGTSENWPQAQRQAAEPLPALEVLMWLGDNIGDFPDLTQELRHQDDPLTGFGDRFFAVPNPMYGSWEDNTQQ